MVLTFYKSVNYVFNPNIETFEEHPILLKFKEGDNKDLGFWFIVTCSWEKNRNNKPETGNRIFIVIRQKGRYAKVSIDR